MVLGRCWGGAGATSRDTLSSYDRPGPVIHMQSGAGGDDFFEGAIPVRVKHNDLDDRQASLTIRFSMESEKARGSHKVPLSLRPPPPSFLQDDALVAPHNPHVICDGMRATTLVVIAGEAVARGLSYRGWACRFCGCD